MRPSMYARDRPRAGTTRASTRSSSPETNRPSTRASSAPRRTSTPSARPPTSSSMASTTRVFPAPVSPVSAVIPGPSTRRRSSMTPRSRTASSVSIGVLPVRETELGLHDFEEVAPLEGDEAGGVGGRCAGDCVAPPHRPQLAAVYGQDRRPVVDELDANGLRLVEHEAPVEEHVGGHGRDDQGPLARRDD